MTLKKELAKSIAGITARLVLEVRSLMFEVILKEELAKS